MTEAELQLAKAYVLLKRGQAIEGYTESREGFSGAIYTLRRAFPHLDLDILATDLIDWDPGVDVLKANFGETTELPSGREFFDYQVGDTFLRIPFPADDISAPQRLLR